MDSKDKITHFPSLKSNNHQIQDQLKSELEEAFGKLFQGQERIEAELEDEIARESQQLAFTTKKNEEYFLDLSLVLISAAVFLLWGIFFKGSVLGLILSGICFVLSLLRMKRFASLWKEWRENLMKKKRTTMLLSELVRIKTNKRFGGNC